MKIDIDIARQELRLSNGKRYAISTAKNGVGEKNGSFCTPRGRHIVRARIGAGQPLGGLDRRLAGLSDGGEIRVIQAECPSNRVLAAMPVVLVGVVLISGAIGSDAYGSNPTLGVITGVVTGFSYAAFLLVLRRGNADVRRPAGPLLDATWVAAVAAIGLGLPLGEVNLVPSWPEHGYLLVLALSSQVVGWLFISVSLPRLPAALTSVILTIQPVGAVLLGIVLVNERPSLIQLAGAGTILLGLMLATLRRRANAEPIAEPELG